MKPRIFIDMDGVIVDFERYMTEHGLTGDEVKRKPGAYLAMQPMPGAIEAVRSIIGWGLFDVWIATKPPTGNAEAYKEKAQWIFHHLPELKRKLVITHDKGMLGGYSDVLIDDRPHKANCHEFRGTLIEFVKGVREWPEILKLLHEKFSFRSRDGVIYHMSGTDALTLAHILDSVAADLNRKRVERLRFDMAMDDGFLDQERASVFSISFRMAPR